MASVTTKQKSSETSADLQERLSAEMQRHAEAVAEILRERQGATREETRSLVGGDQGASAEAPMPHESAAVQKRELSAEQKEELLATLRNRLSQVADHYKRPEGINFADVQRALEANPAALWSLSKMEETGGMPDIVAVEGGAFVFADCCAESPTGRRNCVYDKEAEQYAHESFNGNAVDAAGEFGVEMWSPEFYREMQRSGRFDSRTWSWLKTDAETKSTGDARYGRRNGDHVNVYQGVAEFHNDSGAWRGLLRVQKA